MEATESFSRIAFVGREVENERLRVVTWTVLSRLQALIKSEQSRKNSWCSTCGQHQHRPSPQQLLRGGIEENFISCCHCDTQSCDRYKQV